MPTGSVVIDSVTALIWTISIIGLLFSALVAVVMFTIRNIISGLKGDNEILGTRLSSGIDSLSNKIDENARRAEAYGKETRDSAYHAHDRITQHIEKYHAK